MQEFPNAEALRHEYANPGKVLEKLNVVEQGCAKPFSGCRTVSANNSREVSPDQLASLR